MKLIRQALLAFREGTSDKVYEVDLCEVGPGRFVVNFRYGRRGSTLKDGSKTALPVAQAEAERIYDALVREKTSKGYQPFDPNAPAPPAPAPSVRVEDVEDPRHRKIVALLQGTGRGWTTDFDHLAWRAGELRVRAAAPILAARLDAPKDRRAWHVARALLRCGDPQVLPQLFALWEQNPIAPHVRSMAGHAIGALVTDEERERFLARTTRGFPPEVQAAWAAGDVAQLLLLCAKFPELPDRLYLVADAATRPTLVELLRRVPMAIPTFLGVRRVFQAAEARADGEIWGVIARRFDVERAAIRHIQHRRGGAPAGAWSAGTRKWFRRRAWRTLHRLGSAGLAADYTALAAGLLAALTDADGTAQFRYNWAFGHVLFHNSRRHEGDARHLTWRFHAHRPQALPTRDEAFPALWDAAPDELAMLLGRSRCLPVHAFAARALRANRPAWSTIPVASLIAWFSSPYVDTGAFAAEVAVTRYDPKNPDLELVLALLGCPHAGARTTAMGWVRANPGPFLRDVDFLIRMVLSAEAETRRLALEVIGAATLPPDRAREFVDRVIAAARRADPADELATAKLRDAAAVLVTAFSQEMRDLPLDVVAALIANAAAGTAELGAKILLGHRVRPAELPDDLLAATMTSPHAVVRGIGIRLYGELPDAVLAERFRVLVSLVTSGLPDVRASARPIVARLAGSNPAFGRVLLAALIPLLAVEGPDGMHADVVHLLRSELAALLPHVPAPDVFRLLRASESVVQELGGELLRTNVDPQGLAPAQLAILAGSDVLAVRRTAWALLDARVDDVRNAPDAVLPILDAPWEDSRAFAFRYVEHKVGAEHLTPAVTIAVCDSVRPDVQAFGRRLVTRLFDAADGPTYLSMLAQHPDPAMQLFASAWLEQHAAGHADRLASLVPFLVAVLARPNRAKAAKARVMAFLDREAVRDEASARIVASVLSEMVLSGARTYRDQAIATLAAIRARYPEVAVPLRVVEPETRAAPGAVRAV